VTANIFTPMIAGHSVSTFRKITHSAKNYFQSIDRSSFGFGSASTKVLEQAGNFAGTAGAVAGGITLGMTEAAIAGLAGAGFLAAVAGPQVAVTAGVVGLALLVKGTYSNREAAHIALSKYVWNMVDDQPPSVNLDTADRLNDACDAAMTLLDDGKNQIKLLGSKYTAAKIKMDVLHQNMTTWSNEYRAKLTLYNTTTDPAIKTQAGKDKDKIRDKFKDIWAKESKQGGAIFEYVRRTSHTGNYIQAAHIVALAMKEKLNTGSVTQVAQTDYFAGFEMATNSRQIFRELDVVYTVIMAP